jgi:apolipoprotein N-acyltransferase
VLISAALEVLIFPQPALSWLCWIALAPLMIAVLAPYRPRATELLSPSGAPVLPSPTQGFWLGYATGVLWYGGSCYWIFHVMNTYGGLNAATSVGILILFCLYLGLYHGLYGWLLARTAQRSLRRALLLAPFLWVAVELARARITGFPWDLLGTAQVGNIPLSRIAVFTGVYGMSFEIALINTAFAVAFVIPATRRERVLIAAVVAAGLLQLGNLYSGPASRGDSVATLVQQNIPILEPEAWTTEFFDRMLGDLTRLSLPSANDAAQSHGAPGLIVWPESPAPFFATDPRFRNAVSQIASAAHSYVLVGSLGTRFSAGQPQSTPQAGTSPLLLNSASLVSPAGEWTARYDKVHLVPFGEYVPFKSLLRFAEKLTREVGDFGRGAERVPLALGDHRIGAFICYESIFPDEIREFALRGAEVFVNISNDGWFGESGAPGQHLNMARMRAIENRRWLLRATNTGITASIDPLGRVVARAPRNQRIALEAPYAPISDLTFYTRHGDWFAWMCVVISILGLLGRFTLRIGSLETRN